MKLTLICLDSLTATMIKQASNQVQSGKNLSNSYLITLILCSFYTTRLTDSGEDDDGEYDDQEAQTQAVDDDNPYPLEGKYKNAADRAKLVA